MMQDEPTDPLKRKTLKAIAGTSVVAVAGYPKTADANILAWIFRVLFRAFRRSVVRTVRRALIRPGGIGAGSSYARGAIRIWDGYVAVDLVRAFSGGLHPQIAGVAQHVVEQAEEFGTDALWIAGRPSRIQLDFINDSPDVIAQPEVYFEQVNLETGEQFIRAHPLIFGRDWLPGTQGTIPSSWVRPQDLIPMKIDQAGPIAIRPFVPTSPDVVFDELLVQVVNPTDIQWRS